MVSAGNKFDIHLVLTIRESKTFKQKQPNGEYSLGKSLSSLPMGEGGLNFQGDSDKTGNVNNGTFLGLIKLLFHCDPVLSTHVTKVEAAQEQGKCLQAHYFMAHKIGIKIWATNSDLSS